MYAQPERKRNDPVSPVRLNALGTYSRRDANGQLGVVPFIAPVIGKVASGVHVSFATPSDKRASAVVGRVIAAANAGNLNAVAVLDSRRSIGIRAEEAVWAKGFAQVSPQVLSVYAPHRTDLIAAIPESAQAHPETAASWALQTPVTVPQSTLQQVTDVVVPALLQTEAGQQLKSAAIRSAVSSQAAVAGDTLKQYAIPVGIGLVFYFLSRRR